MKKYFFYFSLLGLTFCSCSKNSTSEAPVTPPVAGPDTILHKMIPFPMGAAVSASLLKTNTKYYDVAKKEFSSITAENAMKFAAVHASQTGFNFTDADYIVSFAQANNQRVHGHTLNWHQSLPAWVTNFVGDSTAWEDLLKTHIQTVVAHFKGKVVSWDVVNELFEDDGKIRNSIWVQKLGPDYIARCFTYAHQADPDALLFYNDYGHEYSASKRTAIIDMVMGLKSRGIPIHGIGLQFHTTYNQTDANISAAISAAAATGLKVHISELDVRVNVNKLPAFVFTSSLAEQQAAKYKFIVKTYKAIPVAQQFGITTWNVGDADSWIPAWQSAPDFPLPFDGNYVRKLAYASMIDGAK
jgi:endo-1,4-beta-xylanase